MIPFNKPYMQGKELQYISDSIKSGKISGDGIFTKKCHDFFQLKYGFKKVLLTTSCTDALEMSAMLLNIQAGDEIISPSYTFVSTVNAFVLRGAKIKFADSLSDNPNIDPNAIEKLVTSRTKAIVIVHYAGVACDMDAIMEIAKKHDIPVVEDAAQAIDSYYRGRPLGSFGTFSTFSFHETKNIISGEGGMLVINDEKYFERAEIIREKGTNRSSFFRGEVNKYGWVDIGSSFLPSDLIAAYLFGQLENISDIQTKRQTIWNRYFENLKHLEFKGFIKLAKLNESSTNNAHMFYILCQDLATRTRLIETLKINGVHAVFHYLSLHKSEFCKVEQRLTDLPNSDRYADTLLRLPLFYELEQKEVDYISKVIIDFFESNV